ncbi:hypothetical protein NE237_006487 [Protea cynaroides]|uniref:Uncharacterized protein n=1 Tax=Protea cynaroides TaxID=273540 RepID=A0A9Q0KMH5_9MAGN|nr:hypothetical protein NE237_006487 [Protea cynaroides]
MVETRKLNRIPKLFDSELAAYKAVEGGVPVSTLEMRDERNPLECGALEVGSVTSTVPYVSPLVDDFIPTVAPTLPVSQGEELDKDVMAASALEKRASPSKSLMIPAMVKLDATVVDTTGEGTPSGESTTADNVSKVEEVAQDVAAIATQCSVEVEVAMETDFFSTMVVERMGRLRRSYKRVAKYNVKLERSLVGQSHMVLDNLAGAEQLCTKIVEAQKEQSSVTEALRKAKAQWAKEVEEL